MLIRCLCQIQALYNGTNVPLILFWVDGQPAGAKLGQNV